MERFKYDKYAPSIREIRSRRALSIIDKPSLPVRPVLVNDSRARGTRIVSARNDLRINKSKSFLDTSEMKENLNWDSKNLLEKKLALNTSLVQEPSELIWAPKMVPVVTNKFYLDLERMESRLSNFYSGC
jgi:hypothetical protein